MISLKQIILFSCTICVWSFAGSKAQTTGRYQIVIDEIFPDPLPSIGLPASEYIELKNVSGNSIDLYNWKLSDGTTTSSIQVHFILHPDSFVLICPASALTSFNAFGPTLGLSNFPSLNNDADIITLLSSENKVIHVVAYESNWFDNAVKSEGGWSLEMKDPSNPCSSDNWKASINPSGGTPCKKNSVDEKNEDLKPPILVRAYTTDSMTIIAIFDEILDSNEAVITTRYLIDQDIANPVEAVAITPLFKEVRLKLKNPLKPAKIYQLQIRDVMDCAGNSIGQNNKCRIGLSSDPDSNDLVINEILFNPRSDGGDYVEFYNRSSKIFDANNLFVSNRNSTGSLSQLRKISETPFQIYPGDFITITEDVASLLRQFVAKNPQSILKLNQMPSFPDDRGNVVLLDRNGGTIDELFYDEKWHFALIVSSEGVALERIHPTGPTSLKDNWTSAAASSGHGTPTYQNSQMHSDQAFNADVICGPEIFSPDNDGIDDICFINYQLPEPNYLATISVYDATGSFVRKLYNNITLSAQGFLSWDGLGLQGNKLPIGNYIVVTELFNLQGKRRKFKNIVTLARKF